MLLQLLLYIKYNTCLKGFIFKYLKYMTSCEMFVNRATNLPTAFSLSKNTYIQIMQCGSIFKSECVKDNKNPSWESYLRMDIYKNHPLYVVIRHDGYICDTDIGHGIIDLREFNSNETEELCIPLFNTLNNAIYNKGKMVGNLYITIKL